MKIRNDFVSNSSSCSFVIRQPNIKQMADVIAPFKNIGVPYEYEQNVDMFVKAKAKNILAVEQLLHKGQFDMRDIERIKSLDPEEVPWNTISTSISSFVNVVEQVPEIIDWIEEVWFESEDYGIGPSYINMTYDFFEKNGCSPDDEHSERDFRNVDAFFAILTGNTNIKKD